MPKPSPIARLYHLDNLRNFLTALLIFHHTAIAYGGNGSWHYSSSFYGPSPVLLAFNALNQSFFIGLFFYLSGAFSSQSARKKSSAEFLKEKLWRLGAPTIVYTLIGNLMPILMVRVHAGNHIDWSAVSNYWKGLRGVKGPVWYSATLLIFDVTYAIYERFSISASRPTFGNPVLNLTAVLTADISACFLVRLVYPIGTVFTPLNLQPAFLPQYIICYISGRSAIPVPSTISKHPLTSLTLTIATAISTLSLILGASDPKSLETLLGGFTASALLIATWHETSGYFLGTAIFALFQKHARRRWGTLARYSYPAVLVHPAVCVALQVATSGWMLDGVLMTAIVGTLGVVGSWIAGWALVRILGLSRVC